MWTINADPNATFPNPMSAPWLDAWARIASLYQDAMQASMQQLMLSSANIIQEHTLRAFMAAAQSCAEALAQNAMSVQQQAVERFTDANQKAMGMMGEAFADAWTAQSRTVH
ncbi:MAG: hypothetical protein JF619_13575 [Massilia sp.]|nr:hypothetical protein [Massilia sp.]